MRRLSLFWGSVLVFVGILILLSNLGIIQMNIWGLIWPFFLIMLGIWILLGLFFRRGKEETASLLLEGATQGRLVFKHGAGRLYVQAGERTGNLLDGTFVGGVEIDKRINGNQLEATLTIPMDNIPFFPGGYSLDWNVNLSPEVPLRLEFESGASDARLNLTNLNITDLTLKSGASSTEINMPANAGMTHARLETGAASVKIKVPENVAARIQAHGGLASIYVDQSRFPRNGEVYQSPDYNQAANRLDISIETGVGSVEIR